MLVKAERMNRYLKRNDGEVYGPVDLPTLQLWATDGRVAPDDKISADRETWTPASDLAELSMEWKVELRDGSIYGPIHILALRDLIHDGTVSRRAKIKHKQSGEEQVACEARVMTESGAVPSALGPVARLEKLRRTFRRRPGSRTAARRNQA